ncbi:MAG TPA: type IV pilus assembly protein PilM [Planctomycetota bacterium]|nr:type IV pilus assembly protein PilM [Planctomycetota bacterium]
MAFHTIWSVDVGKSALKAVRLRRERNSIEILAIDKVDYPLSDNGVDTGTQARDALSAFRQRNDIKDPVVVAHPGQGTFSRFIKIPAFDQKKLKDMVRFEASQQIPFPLDEVIWDYHLVNREYLPGEEREVGLFAVRKEAVDDYLLEFTQEGLSVEMLSIGYLGLLNFIKFDINPPEPSIVLDIGATHTDLILVDGDRFWIRPLPHSGNDISKAIMARFKLSFPDAERLKLETGKVPQQAEKIFKAVIQPKLQELAQEIQRSIGFYRSQAGDIKFSKLYLLGNGSRVVGIKKFFEEVLGMPVEAVKSIGRLRVNRDVNVKLLQTELAAFGTALGLGIQAVGAGTCQVDLVPREEKIRKEIARKRKHVFFAAGILLLLILVAWGIVSAKITHLESRKAESDTQMRVLKTTGIDALERDTNVTTFKKIDVLTAMAEDRQGALDALRSLERVLSDVGRKDPPSILVDAGNAAAVAAAVEDAKTKLNDRVWIPYLKIERIRWPETARTGSGARGSRGADVQPTVGAYKVTACAFVKERENAQASADALKSLLIEPLEKDLTLAQTTKVKDVKMMPGRGGHKTVFFQPVLGSGQLGSGNVGDIEQDGGPFFEAELFWYMVPRFPPEPPKEEPVDTGTGSGKSPGKGSGR